MVARLLLLALTIASARAQTDDPGDFLLRVRERVLQTIDRLPKYMCALTIDRVESRVLDAGPTSCDRLIGLRKERVWKLKVVSSGRLKFDVTVFGSDERYSHTGGKPFEDREIEDMAAPGALSNGGFGGYLALLFRNNEASFSFKGETVEDGRKLFEYGFRTPVEKSHYEWGLHRKRLITAYDGDLFVDAATLDPVRLSIRTDELPPATDACEALSTVTYRRVTLNQSTLLLPAEARLQILTPNAIVTDNRMVYQSCREFHSESTVTFDDSAGSARKPVH